MKEMLDLDKYELKKPSYKLKNRNYDFFQDLVDENLYTQSRFEYKDGEWKSKQGVKDEITLMFTGDLLCQENIINAYKKSNGRYDFTPCFDYLRPFFRSADFVAGNLETPVSESAPYRGEILTHEGPFFCNAPVEYLAAIKYAGYDMLTTENNHTLDAGVDGLRETIENIRKFNIIQTGTFMEDTEKFTIVDICGFKVGFTAFGRTYNTMQKNLTRMGRIKLLNTFSENRAKKVYDGMKKAGAEFTICFPHWGKEFDDTITERQAKMADTFAEIGYDAVLGAHSHVLQKFRYIDDKPVAYSLGNIMTHMNLAPDLMDTQYPAVCVLKLSRKCGKPECKIQFIPCRIQKDIGKVPFVVLPYNKALDKYYNDDIREKLSDVPCKVANLLEAGETIIDTDYPIDQENLNECMINVRKHNEYFENAVIDKDGMSTACDGSSSDTLNISCKGFFSKCEEMREGFFRIYDGYAELEQLTATATVVKISAEINGKPVLSVKNKINGNYNTRIVYVGKYTRYIGDKMFKDFRRLESVRLFNNLEKIGNRAFEGCIKLTGIVIPGSVKIIGKNAFHDCENLISIKIPSGVVKIAGNAFKNCKKLVIYCEKDSYADKFAKKHKIPARYMDL